MKTLKWMLLLVAAATLGKSCFLLELDLPQWGPQPPIFYYTLDLSFQDAQGNDLVRGIGEDEDAEGFIVKKSEYTLEVVHNGWKTDTANSRIGLIKESDDYRMRFAMSDWKSDASKDSVVTTLRLRCPYILGEPNQYYQFSPDGAPRHRFVTYWRPIKSKSWEYLCYRIEFDGKEITAISYKPDTKVSVATIILDRE